MLPQLPAQGRILNQSVAVVPVIILAMACIAMIGVIAMIAVLLVQHLGILKGMAFTGYSSKERSSGEEVKRLHRRRF